MTLPASAPRFDAVLFDLDGTLVDTAPDMAGALNDMRETRGLTPMPYDELRPRVSHGSRALVEHGFDPADEATTQQLIQEFLTVYGGRVATASQLFDGMESLLASLESRRIPWGVVTNKPGDLSDALLHALELTPRMAVHIAGDTLAHKKPHPMPLLHAARQIDVLATRCVYVGDAERDIRAGRTAGMRTVSAAYGYVLPDDCATRWGADAVVHTVDELCAYIGDQFNFDEPARADH